MTKEETINKVLKEAYKELDEIYPYLPRTYGEQTSDKIKGLFKKSLLKALK